MHNNLELKEFFKNSRYYMVIYLLSTDLIDNIYVYTLYIYMYISF